MAPSRLGCALPGRGCVFIAGTEGEVHHSKLRGTFRSVVLVSRFVVDASAVVIGPRGLPLAHTDHLSSCLPDRRYCREGSPSRSHLSRSSFMTRKRFSVVTMEGQGKPVPSATPTKNNGILWSIFGFVMFTRHYKAS
ncbi:hypothetical protein FA95DRAFT_1566812 [Auriscalpium vulgare]|uniref:Uncharacterized protein n=1 Tax=Auriscalpium vulgare TaxID=40419 RepID=A0ACB8R723_9AGAM|nr:hypothetical protein FA95DRAFT_1566812 [Auriscalpium vulgare]